MHPTTAAFFMGLAVTMFPTMVTASTKDDHIAKCNTCITPSVFGGSSAGSYCGSDNECSISRNCEGTNCELKGDDTSHYTTCALEIAGCDRAVDDGMKALGLAIGIIIVIVVLPYCCVVCIIGLAVWCCCCRNQQTVVVHQNHQPAAAGSLYQEMPQQQPAQGYPQHQAYPAPNQIQQAV